MRTPETDGAGAPGEVTGIETSRLPWPTVSALMLTMVASQAAAIILSPVLVEIARDFDVSIAVAGQLRAIGGALAGVGALTVGWLAGRIGARATSLSRSSGWWLLRA